MKTKLFSRELESYIQGTYYQRAFESEILEDYFGRLTAHVK